MMTVELEKDNLLLLSNLIYNPWTKAFAIHLCSKGCLLNIYQHATGYNYLLLVTPSRRGPGIK